jgi:flavodoxin
MKTLIVYDSKFGNTKQVADAVGGSIAGARVVPVDEADLASLRDYDLLVVGSPTQGGRPTPAVAAFLRRIPADALIGLGVAAFDTRISAADCGALARFALKVFGFAAGRIETSLKSKGGRPVVQAEGFVVKDNEGPLAEGELERARTWARQLTSVGALSPR